MKVNRVSEIIECLYLNNLISKKYKMIFQNQYDYLENEELLKKMGIILKKDNSICDKRGLIVDVMINHTITKFDVNIKLKNLIMHNLLNLEKAA